MNASTPLYDYVVVGAGSAGTVIAPRPSEDSSVPVLLLEAAAAGSSSFVRIPLGVGKLLGDERYVWRVEIEPQAEMHHNRIYWPSGRMLGGSSSVKHQRSHHHDR